MSKDADATKLDRRSFLKSAAAAGATVAAGTQLAAAAEVPAQGATPVAKPAGAKLPSETFITHPGSDFMADVLKSIGLKYVAINPAAGFRSLQESIINYSGNKDPEIITCLHEETAGGMAHGYAKAAGQPLGVMVHGTVGLQHAAMAIYNAWVDRVPMIVFAGNGLRADTRRPGVEWNHSVQDPADMVRDFIKWDDQPVSLQHFAESAVRAYKYTMTAPMEPVMVCLDMGLPFAGEDRVAMRRFAADLTLDDGGVPALREIECFAFDHAGDGGRARRRRLRLCLRSWFGLRLGLRLRRGFRFGLRLRRRAPRDDSCRRSKRRLHTVE